jgi:CubicO group peptidase (beta-lactamase class C family)
MSQQVSRRRFFRQSGTLIALASTSPFASVVNAFQTPEKSRNDPSTKSLIDKLANSIPDWMSEKGVPGLSVALIKDAHLVWSQGFGVKSTATKEAVTAETVFEAASLSKPAFAYAALKLCEEGRLGLDTPLIEHLPDPLIPNEPRLKGITARTVLSHSSGLPHGRPEGAPITLRFTPGDRFAYSATGIQYLQMVVERLTRQSLADFTKARLLAPFGMKSSNFGWVKSYEKDAAQGHWRDGSPGLSGNGKELKASPEEQERTRKHYYEFKYPSASAGLYTTAGDYARFIIEMIEPSRRDRFRLSEGMIAEMLKPQIKINDSISWGLGWGIERTGAGDAFWHWGDWGVFRNFVIASRKQRAGVVIFTNSFNGPKVYREIVPAVLGGGHPSLAWVEQYRP